VVVGISTDKACQPENIYGYSKKILEQTFLDHYSDSTRFVCTRFANVACSNGSVIPFWIDSARKGQSLKLTDSRMNRLMFTSRNAAELIRQSIDYAEQSTRPFVLCSIMKSVGMLDLANQISREFGSGQKPEIIGLRPGERLNEILVSQHELPHAAITEDGRYITLHTSEFGTGRVLEPLSSLSAEYMSESEMQELYRDYIDHKKTAVSLAYSR
jgi:FlaA1/EpsC-like NDP-sugar epimerase